MKRALVILAGVLFFAQIVLAVDLDIEIVPIQDVVIVGNDNKVSYTLYADNKGQEETFQIYSLVEADFKPKESFLIKAGEKKTLNIEVGLNDRTMREIRGPYAFSYEIKGDKSGTYDGKITAHIVEIQDAFEIGEIKFEPSDTSAEVTIKNKYDRAFENVNFEMNSEFFDKSFTESFSKKEEKKISIPIDSNLFPEISAGNYFVRTQVSRESVSGETKSSIVYLEEGGLSVSEKSEGFIIRKTTIVKTNEGNIPTVAESQASKNIITHLLTTHSTNPDRVEESGFTVNYFWSKELAPGEFLEITVTTNYTVPLILILLIIIIVLGVKIYFRDSVLLEKRVSYVKTKGGEFALKINLKIKARRHVEEVHITDRIPSIAKLYEKFGRMPDKVDHEKRLLHWNIQRLDAGEERVYSYVIYSSVNIVGKFELPSASVSYKKDGEHKTVHSNKTAFLSESVGD